MSQPTDTEQQRARFREKAAAARALEDEARAKLAARVTAARPLEVEAPTAAPAKGRRSGSERRQRTKLIAFRVRDEEYAFYAEEANQMGVYLADLARVRMKRGGPRLRSVPLPAIERKLASKLLGQLGNLCSNANQIARRSNRSGIVDADDLREFRAAMVVFVEMRAALFEVLGRAP
jgi:hypothetical protein